MSRVAQLDSFLLDGELQSILLAPVTTTLSPTLLASYTPELHFALKAGLLHLGSKINGASYGAKLQNLVVSELKVNTAARWRWVLLATLPGYIHTRLRDYMLVNGWPDYPRSNGIVRLFQLSRARRRRELRRLLWDLLTRLEQIWTSMKLVNFLLFLYDGKYPTLLFRLLRLRYTYAQKSVARNVSFDFLNRQLVWEAFTVSCANPIVLYMNADVSSVGTIICTGISLISHATCRPTCLAEMVVSTERALFTTVLAD